MRSDVMAAAVCQPGQPSLGNFQGVARPENDPLCFS
jgi:hypothetical protein